MVELLIPGLEEKIRRDTDFFDHLTETIPPSLYFPRESNPEQWKTARNKNKNVKDKTKLKEKAKAAKRQKFDPSKPRTVVEIQQLKAKKEGEKNVNRKESNQASTISQNIKESPLENLNSSESVAEASSNSLENVGKKEVGTIDNLRERLKVRLESLRSQRKVKEKEEAVLKAKNWLSNERERSMPTEVEESKEIKNEGKDKKGEKQEKEKGEKKDAKGKKRKKDEDEDETEKSLQLEFGKLETKLESSVEITQKRKKEKTEQLLAKAVALQKLLKNEDAKDKAVKHAWEAASQRASGNKVLDNPKLLKRTLKKKQKSKIKSAKEWEERKKHVKESMDARQTKRKEKIKERKDTKKAAKIAKREKKLLRPGFEGRVDKVLNSTN